MKKQTDKPAHVIHPLAVYTLDTASRDLGIARPTLAQAVRNGTLLASRPNKEYRIVGGDLMAWVMQPHALKSKRPGALPGPDCISPQLDPIDTDGLAALTDI